MEEWKGIRMTEKEKCSRGLLYNLMDDQEMMAELTRCKDLCHRLNQVLPSRTDEREQILREIIGRIGGSFVITTPFYCDYGYNIEIGEHFYANHHLVILDCAKVRIGDHVFIAPNCCITAASHPIDAGQRSAGFEYALPVTIGNHVWIGANTVILPGVTIGDHAVIGAGSVVTKDIPAHVVAVGNPCRVLREIDQRDRACQPDQVRLD